MSSPVVITGVIKAAAVARKQNRADAHEFMQLAEALAAQNAAQGAQLRAAGMAVPGGGPTPASVRKNVEALLAADKGWEAVNVAHEYWQSLKHRYGDMLDELQTEAFFKQIERDERMAEAEAERTQAQSQNITIELDERATQHLAAEAGTSVAERIALVCTQVRQAAAKLDLLEAAEAELATVDAGNEYEALALVDGIAARYKNKIVRMRREKAMQATVARRLAAEKSIAHTRLAGFRRQVEELPFADREKCAELCDHLETDIHAAVSVAQVDERVDATRAAILKTRAQRGLFGAVVDVLRKQGYDEIGEMQTVLPGQIRAFYLTDPLDSERAIEIGVGDDGMTISAETVRLNGAKNANSLQQDTEAQRRLCKALEAAAHVEGEGWSLVEVVRTAPGREAKVCAEVGQMNEAAQSGARTQRKKEASL